MKIFGNTIFNAHLFALLVSFFTLFALFNFCEKYFGRWSGLFAVDVLLPQPLFLAQSGLVLPEMALSLFVVLSLHFFLDHKMAWYFFSAPAAILIKESAIVLFATLNVVLLYSLYRKEKKLRETILSIALVNSPLLWWALHLVVHKIQMGNFFFHEHTGYISFRITDILDKPERGFYLLFLAQGRNTISVLLVSSFLYAFLKKKTANNPRAQFMGWMFLFLFLIFFSLNYFSDRYMLVGVDVLIAMFAGTTWRSLESAIIRFAFMLISTGASFFSLATFSGISDHNLGYVNAVKVYQEAADYMKTNNQKNDTIYAFFNMNEGLKSHIPGYMEEENYFVNVKAQPNDECRYFIFFNVENDYEQQPLTEKYKLQPVQKFQKGVAWVEIMKKPMDE